jgi:hypothetical protein
MLSGTADWNSETVRGYAELLTADHGEALKESCLCHFYPLQFMLCRF